MQRHRADPEGCPTVEYHSVEISGFFKKYIFIICSFRFLPPSVYKVVIKSSKEEGSFVKYDAVLLEPYKLGENAGPVGFERAPFIY